MRYGNGDVFGTGDGVARPVVGAEDLSGRAGVEAGSADLTSGHVVAEVLEGLTHAVQGLGVVGSWLQELDGGTDLGGEEQGVDGGVVGAVLAGLSRVDGLVLAVVSRAVGVAEVAGCGLAEGIGRPSEWVAARMGLSGGEAARLCRLGARLEGLPAVLESLEQGEISRGHAVGLVEAAQQQRHDHDLAERTRRAAEREQAEQERLRAEAAVAAAADAAQAAARQAEADQAEQDRQRRVAREAAERAVRAEQAAADRQAALLGRARAGETPEQIGAEAARRRASDSEVLVGAEAAQQAARTVRTWTDAQTGAGAGRWVLPTAEHELLLSLLDSLRTFDDKDCEPSERRSFEQRQADAFSDLVRRAARVGDLPSCRGQRPHVSVTVPWSTLTHTAELPGRTRHGTTLSPAEARRIACDAALTRVVLGASGMVLDVGRETRVWTNAQYKAAEQTFGGCCFPTAQGKMCGRAPVDCDLHHFEFWRNGGRTDQANGGLLCNFHHRLVHAQDWRLIYDHQGQRLTLSKARPDGSHCRRTVNLARPHPDRLPL
ncbi:MAG: DUF222 domain-containing protein [Euzebya sp.]